LSFRGPSAASHRSYADEKERYAVTKQTLDLADHTAVGAVDNSGAGGSANDQDLAKLVWKYFREEITETLRETQEDLAPERTGSSQQVSHRKR